MFSSGLGSNTILLLIIIQHRRLLVVMHQSSIRLNLHGVLSFTSTN